MSEYIFVHGDDEDWNGQGSKGMRLGGGLRFLTDREKLEEVVISVK